MPIEISIDEFAKCLKSEGCDCFDKLNQALMSLPAGCTPSLSTSLSTSVRMAVRRDYEDDYAVVSSYTERDNTKVYSSYKNIVFSCEAIQRQTKLAIQFMIVAALCLRDDLEPTYYQSLLVDKVNIFKEGFEAGLMGECPRLEFEILGEEEIYEEGYKKGASAALVRAANKAGRN